jgi:RNA polymerase sigma-70 factor (ECF subfamily)
MNEKILKKALTGDKKAFGQLYNEYFDPLWRYVYSRIKNKEITSDIVSESFIALYENIKSIKYSKATKSYLYKIAKNKLIKFYSEEKTILLSEFSEDRIEIKKNTKRKISEKLIIKLEEILKKIPGNYEEVLRLRFLAGLKIREVAEILNKSEGNIKVLQNRAIKKAQALVNNNYKLKC